MKTSFFTIPLLIASMATLSGWPAPCSGAAGRVVINEVYYDHPGSDAGWEYVELLAAGDAADLTGFSLEFADGRTGSRRVLWEAYGTLALGRGEYLLVGGSERAEEEALRLSGTIENGPDAIILLCRGAVVDLVGYGALEDPSLYESSPAADPAAGMSLARRPDGSDSNSNSSDFVPSVPTPGYMNFHQFDLEISLEDGRAISCAGGPFVLPLRVLNRGLSLFEGEFRVVVRGPSGETLSEDLHEAVLGSGEAIEIETLVRSGPGTEGLLELRLESDIDQNRRNDSAPVYLRHSPASVVLNEIMYRPAPGGCEWIELFNRTAAAADLRGWSIADAAGRRSTLCGDCLSIDPGGFMIVASDPQAASSAYAGRGVRICSVKGGWPSLNDRDSGTYADMVDLSDSCGALIDRIAYSDLLGDERGWSIERISPDACSCLEGGIWHRCASSKGETAGGRNSVFRGSLHDSPGLRLDPETFCPGIDGILRICGCRREGESGFRVTVFDMGGSVVRRVYAEEGGGMLFACGWDGRSDSGGFVSTGLYICVAEYFCRGGGVCRREKRCVAVYSKW